MTNEPSDQWMALKQNSLQDLKLQADNRCHITTSTKSHLKEQESCKMFVGDARRRSCRRAQIALVERTPDKLQPPATRVGRWSQSSLAPHQLVTILLVFIQATSKHQATCQQAGAAFPGVSRDLASFCSARPSLSIDLAPMLIHVKKNTSFNYKLYLFSNDEHVFQTGQIVPRDDFRIHSFPVKLKHLNEFVPTGEHGGHKSTFDQQQQQQRSLAVNVYQLVETRPNNQTFGGTRPSLVRVASASFDTKRFFAQVPLVPESHHPGHDRHRHASSATLTVNKWPRSAPSSRSASLRTTTTTSTTERPSRSRLPLDVQGDMLPGDESFGHHDVALLPDVTVQPQAPANANEHIEFDRDDQVAILGQAANRLRELNRRQLNPSATSADHQQQDNAERSHSAGNSQHHQAMVMPVGSFSSFRVNLTYLARKDFGQLEPELVRLRVDARRFQVNRVDLLWPSKVADGDHEKATAAPTTTDAVAEDDLVDEPEPEDYAFLSHKLLRDRNTRITSISQIYEEWITRNFYTIVYIQRRLKEADEELESLAADGKIDPSARRHASSESKSLYNHDLDELVTDRLVFRGSSIVLLGADQLNHHVKASAFITEKNGLHYYLEFLSNGKFYLGAIDWTKRPFKFIDSQRFPIKPTRTQFDNEELLLCPPSVCYSDQPVDELVGYGRLALSDKFQNEASILAKSSSSPSPAGNQIVEPSTQSHRVELALLSGQHSKPVVDQPAELLLATRSLDTTKEFDTTDQKRHQVAGPDGHQSQTPPPRSVVRHQSEPISLDSLIEATKSGSSRLDVRLHLRDWAWQVPRTREAKATSKMDHNSHYQNSSRFVWHYEWARRNEIKVAPDTYGFALVGHEIDASYRVYNELYLISANQLISINYTLANETVTSVHPIEDEFVGLSSSLLDPITGAFYDRYSNQIFFFKGDRYVGYDYATKRPLDDFLLPPAVDESLLLMIQSNNQRQQTTSGAMLSPKSTSTTMTTAGNKLADSKQPSGLLVSSLPVVGILGKQHHVDAIYHDLHDDVVYVFAGMKFYTHKASDFKNGAFKQATTVDGGRIEPQMHCINERFLAGCRFDAAYPNPCESTDDRLEAAGRDKLKMDDDNNNLERDKLTSHAGVDRHHRQHESANQVEYEAQAGAFGSIGGKNKLAKSASNFSEQQQMKLRSIAARGGLMDLLLENTLVAQGAARALEPFLAPETGAKSGSTTDLGSRSNDQEQMVVHLLIAMVLITVLVTVAMIVVVLNWTRVKSTGNQQRAQHDSRPTRDKRPAQNQRATPFDAGQLLAERVAYPPAISDYLANQYKQQTRHQPPVSYYYGPQTALSHGRRLSGNAGQQLVSPAPPIPPPPTEPRRPFREHTNGKLAGMLGRPNSSHQDLNLVDSSIF